MLPAVTLVALRWIDPPTTAFMLANRRGAVHEWTDVEHVSRNFLVMVIGQEDQQFPSREAPFDVDEFRERADAWWEGRPDTSGSTIDQQLAKNLFLPEEQTAVRKGYEALLAYGVYEILPKRRVLELYVNTAQFGPNVYGVCAASWYYFGHSSRSLTLEESAKLVGLLPSPLHVWRGDRGGLAFDPRPHNPSAENMWRAFELRRKWFRDVGGYAATEQVGVLGMAHEQPAGPDDCSTMPDDVAELIGR